jgi:hypothetical protein
MRRGALLIPLVILGACSSAVPPSVGSIRPEGARIVTSDIPNFWAAFDQMHASTDTLPLHQYIDAGTVGLHDFTSLRWKNAATLARVIWPLRAYYASIRNNTLNVADVEPKIRQVFAVADTLIDHATFPDVYFAIGGMATGGTTSPHGLLIGTELYSEAPDSPLDVLSAWQRQAVRPASALPAIIAHELVHYQQHYRSSPHNLLGQAIREGSADFIAGLLASGTINDAARAYGDAHQAEVWADFQTQMNGADMSRWLYNGNTLTATTTRPADLGYYVGARIAQAYYEKATDKHRAIQDILTIRDFNAFLTASGYAGR